MPRMVAIAPVMRLDWSGTVATFLTQWRDVTRFMAPVAPSFFIPFFMCAPFDCLTLCSVLPTSSPRPPQ
jgi:hypothetical protein